MPFSSCRGEGRRGAAGLGLMVFALCLSGCQQASNPPHHHLAAAPGTLTSAAYLAAGETEAKGAMSGASADLVRAAEEMAQSALNFWASLTPEQQQKAAFDFKDEERVNWHFIPRERKGLPWKDMTMG